MQFSRSQLSGFCDIFKISCIYFLLIQVNANAEPIDVILEKIESTPGLGSAIQKNVRKKTEFYTALDTDIIHAPIQI
jgi:hypothetical protein